MPSERAGQLPTEYEISTPAMCARGMSLAVGYSLPTAIADSLDNSITAHEKNVWIDFHWDSCDSRIAIVDDGDGRSRLYISGGPAIATGLCITVTEVASTSRSNAPRKPW